MDIKIKGITKAILKEALAQAKDARMEILDVMEKEIAEPRKEVSEYAPKTVTFMIKPEKIKDVIGKGGETITKIILEASNVKAVTDMNAVKVDLEDDGRVIIYHSNKEIIQKTREMIENIVREPEEGKIYNAKVVKVEEFGAFVQIWPGCEGLVHISELDTNRVEKTEDVVKLGDEVVVMCIGTDKKGRLNFSRRKVLAPSEKHDKEKKERKPKKEEKTSEEE
jgi:polyribonucleotide nucleotidyltransferase